MMHEEPDPDQDELADRLGGDLLRRVRAQLEPVEYLLWADRPLIRGGARIPPIPALFVAALAGLSGFALSALFGILQQPWLDGRAMVWALGFAPMVLGGLIGLDLSFRALRAWLRWRRLARTVYAITDQRAIIARVESTTGALHSLSIRPGMVQDLHRFEYPDGSGDLHFVRFGETEQWLPFGFFEVADVGEVESLVRETLLGGDQEWWKSGKPAPL